MRAFNPDLSEDRKTKPSRVADLAGSRNKNFIPMHKNAQPANVTFVHTTKHGVPPWGGSGFVCPNRMCSSNSLTTNRLQGQKCHLKALYMSANLKTCTYTIRPRWLTHNPHPTHKNAQALAPVYVGRFEITGLSHQPSVLALLVAPPSARIPQYPISTATLGSASTASTNISCISASWPNDAPDARCPLHGRRSSTTRKSEARHVMLLCDPSTCGCGGRCCFRRGRQPARHETLERRRA